MFVNFFVKYYKFHCLGMSTENHNQFINEAFLCIADNKFSSKNILHVCRSGNAIIVHLVKYLCCIQYDHAGQIYLVKRLWYYYFLIYVMV